MKSFDRFFILNHFIRTVDIKRGLMKDNDVDFGQTDLPILTFYGVNLKKIAHKILSRLVSHFEIQYIR